RELFDPAIASDLIQNRLLQLWRGGGDAKRGAYLHGLLHGSLSYTDHRYAHALAQGLQARVTKSADDDTVRVPDLSQYQRVFRHGGSLLQLLLGGQHAWALGSA